MTPADLKLPWFVVNTRPQKEELVRVLLEQAGLEVFMPRILEWHGSRRRMRERMHLLFPGYVFVGMSVSRDYPRVRWTPGVKRVLGAGDMPTPIDRSLVEELQARMGRKGYLMQSPNLMPGDKVEVRHGPFVGLLGVVEGCTTGQERVRILLTLFERRTSVEMDQRDLLRVGHRV